MADDAPLLDQAAQHSASLTGAQWLRILSMLTYNGAKLTEAGRVELGGELLDTAADIVKQIDPDGWASTEP